MVEHQLMEFESKMHDERVGIQQLAQQRTCTALVEETKAKLPQPGALNRRPAATNATAFLAAALLSTVPLTRGGIKQVHGVQRQPAKVLRNVPAFTQLE